jgi:hypothetical protein
VRIFHKELKSLVKVYPDIHLIVADGLGDKLVDGIQIHDIGKPSGRKERFLKFPKLALKKALQINADLFHLHDPELLMIANGLNAIGGKAIYDSHEDLPRQIMSKTYIPKILRKIISGFLERFENRKVSKMYGVIAASNKLFVERFAKVNTNGIDIHNYPKRDDIDFCENWDNREMAIGYIGGIFKTRGIIETLDAIEGTDFMYLEELWTSNEVYEIQQDSKLRPINIVSTEFIRKNKGNRTITNLEMTYVYSNNISLMN